MKIPHQRKVRGSVHAAELLKIEVETAKLNAEREKTLQELEDRRREREKKFYQKESFYFGVFKAFIGALLLVPVAWFYFWEIAIPTMRVENIRLARDNELVRDSLDHVAERYEGRLQTLRLVHDSLDVVGIELENRIMALTFVRDSLDKVGFDLKRRLGVLEIEKDSIDQVGQQLQHQIQNLLGEMQIILAGYSRLDSINLGLAAEYRILSKEASLTEERRNHYATAADGIEEVRMNERANPTLQLRAGWNLVGYTGTTPMRIEDAFAPIVDVLILAKDQEGGGYSPEYGINSIGELLPGHGYSVFISNAVTFQFPK